MRAQTGEARSADYLLQRMSAAVQRGNAISIMSGLLEGARDTITNCLFCCVSFRLDVIIVESLFIFILQFVFNSN